MSSLALAGRAPRCLVIAPTRELAKQVPRAPAKKNNRARKPRTLDPSADRCAAPRVCPTRLGVTHAGYAVSSPGTTPEASRGGGS